MKKVEKLTYPLKLKNGMAFLELPREISGKDADRLCKMIRSIAFDIENEQPEKAEKKEVV